MCSYMFDERLKKAYEKSDEVSALLSYKDDRMISTQEIIDAVKANYKIEIDIATISFSEIDNLKSYGAMMKTELDGEGKKPQKASIILNADNDIVFQRFSLLHEIGHLVACAWEKDDILGNGKKFVVSTHIDYDITNIPEKHYSKNKYMLNEQIANIFALRVLMPTAQFYKKLSEYGDISKVARFFGLTNDAVVSRAMIGA